MADATPLARVGPIGLGAAEVRVLGCLLEKQTTTPDVYPLSLNALRLACNQSTNREPVVDYDEREIREALHRLERHGLARLASGAGSRATKYRHLLAEALPMDDGERATLCVLMLRGPQTPGELKQRTERMHRFADLEGVHATLGRLIERELAVRLERRPGQKEERYAQRLQSDSGTPGERHGSAGATSAPYEALPASGVEPPREISLEDGGPFEDGGGAARDLPTLEQLHLRIARLEREVAELRTRLGEPGSPRR